MSLSSGEGHDIKDYRRQLCGLVGYRLTIQRFSDEEMMKYLKEQKCGKDFGGGDDDDCFDFIKSLCGTNPSLLVAWVHYDSIERRSVVKEIVKLYLEDNLKSYHEKFAALNTERFVTCQKYFYLASSSILLSVEEQIEYNESWFHHHNIMVMSGSMLKNKLPTFSNVYDKSSRQCLKGSTKSRRHLCKATISQWICLVF